jgi:2,5-dichlorohydroquinone reductive dechlorinase
MSDGIEQLVVAANAPLIDPEMKRTIGLGTPRFELYHFALSLCSQKVRICLVEKGAGFVAHDINLQSPLLGNYDPAYVKLRMAAHPGTGYATGYSGRSSVSSEGFDPAVVPTLVDWPEHRVVVDSLAICRHIDRVVEPENSLVPHHLAQQVLDELSIVDATPHVAFLYGAHPDVDFRPERLKSGMPGVHDRKIAKIEDARSTVAEDASLVTAYDAKIAKEIAGKRHVTTPESMRSSVQEILRIVHDLDQRLSSSSAWICGDRLTLADLFWAISLFRMKWLGMAFTWEGEHLLNETQNHAVADYAARLFVIPSFKTAVIDWPGTPRSEFVSEHYSN